MPRLPAITSAALLALVISTSARAALPAADLAHPVARPEARELDTSASGGALRCDVSVAPDAAWMSAELLESHERWAEAQVERTPAPSRPAKLRQDASFPAAFVFQSHSALYLARFERDAASGTKPSEPRPGRAASASDRAPATPA